LSVRQTDRVADLKVGGGVGDDADLGAGRVDQTKAKLVTGLSRGSAVAGVRRAWRCRHHRRPATPKLDLIHFVCE